MVSDVELVNTLEAGGLIAGHLEKRLEDLRKGLPEGSTFETVEACLRRLHYITDALVTEADMLKKWGS